MLSLPGSDGAVDVMLDAFFVHPVPARTEVAAGNLGADRLGHPDKEPKVFRFVELSRSRN